MRDVKDSELLLLYVQQGSEEAFAELVRRHINLVYSAALRHAGNQVHAQEIAQAVFIILARKASKLRKGIVLEAWLFETTRLTAISFLRGERRRQFREQEAYMQSTLQDSGSEEVWEQLSPMLDESLAQLGHRDRELVLLRYFKDMSLREVAEALDMNEPAVRKRAERALDKLRGILTKKGVVLPVAVLVSAISSHSVYAAPAGLAGVVSMTAVAKGGAAGHSTLALVKGVLKIMAWSKAKTALISLCVFAVMGGTATVVIREATKIHYNPADFRATTYSTGPDFVTNSYGHPLSYTFPASPDHACSIHGLLNQCMEVSGWRYLMDPDVAAGSVMFPAHGVFNGEQWVAAFEKALQTANPGWWDQKTKVYRQENLVLVRIPQEKTVLVVPQDKASRYR